ncbi:MAG: DUF6240 domain-containing protein [Lachnospiraceae bacterium]|nr:DUF6240 domain-containing protein [Lachnospiraceae bacterium]
MQIDQIRETDILKNNKATDMEHILSGANSQKKTEKTEQPLRSIQMDSPFYNKDALRQDTVAEQLEKDMQRGTEAADLCNQAAVYANTTSAEDLQKMEEEGFDPMNTEVNTIITVVDRIKLALAKGGADISAMGGLSQDKVEAMTGSTATATMVAKQLQEMDIPVDEELSEEIETAVCKTQELPNTLPENSVKYLLTNELEPTIDNVYQASYAVGSGEYATEGESGFAVNNPVPEELQGAFEAVIAKAGLTSDTVNLQDCMWLMDNQIPVTEENLLYFKDLKEMDLNLSHQEMADLITQSVMEGRAPGETTLITKDCVLQQAKDIYEKQQKELSGITTTRQREEARMLMSVQANYMLLKRGVAIDTMGIQETLEQIKEMERNLLSQVLSGETLEETEENISTYETFTEQVNDLKLTPAAVLAQTPNVEKMTLNELRETGARYRDTFEKANQRYETLWTAPRKDMGDSIQKAFANVDDILEDLQMETSEANRRAVRILSYNEMELTPDHIAAVKTADEKVQNLFKALKPAVVTEMIKTGYNPLDKSIGELSDMARDMGEQSDREASEEQYAKFLWKLEQTKDITPEQRESYIGVYRLIHQVEAGDGAAIGALLAQGTEVTLRNLMTAVRSGKHTGREYAIDDSFGEIESFDVESLSITDQIEMAFQRECLSEAGQEMTPIKMNQFADESSYMDLTPEQFRDQLTEMENEQVSNQEIQQETAYQEQIRGEVARALQSEEQVYEILKRYDLPTTPAFLSGVTQMLQDRNSIYRNLLKFAGKQDDKETTITDLIEQVMEDFGEAVKTPEEMAKAQRKLEETAENVIKNMMVEQDVTSIDVRGMKLVTTQIKALGQMAKKSETYHIPIMVEDQVGNLSLKIVRGTEEKGLVEVALDTEPTGVVRASFRYEAGTVEGALSFDRQEVRDLFADHAHLLAEAMGEETELPVTFSFGVDETIDANDIYGNSDGNFETTVERSEVSTKVLYGIARSFIETFTEII